MGSPRVSLVEIAFVLPGAENGTLRGDIKTEEAAPNHRDGCNDVDVSNRHDGDNDHLLLKLRQDVMMMLKSPEHEACGKEGLSIRKGCCVKQTCGLFAPHLQHQGLPITTTACSFCTTQLGTRNQSILILIIMIERGHQRCRRGPCRCTFHVTLIGQVSAALQQAA